MEDDSANLKWLRQYARNQTEYLLQKICAWYNTEHPILKVAGRVSFIAFGPLLLLAVIYNNITPLRGCFNPISESQINVTQQASQVLTMAYNAVSSFNPPMQLFSDWLPYDISIHNGSKVAFAVKRSDGSVTDYKEGPITLLIQTEQATTTIEHGMEETIARGVPLSAIPQYKIGISSQFGVNDWNAHFKKGEPISPEINVNHGETCLTLTMKINPYLLLIYLECWIIFMGIILLIKETSTFLVKGFSSYFKSK